jgi:lipid II:glycine glycyltransferase (peptidoglycan interpeptide bridge formation enzyme)
LSYRSEFVTDRDSWNHIVFAGEGNDLVQGYEWGDFRQYAGYTPYRVVVRDGQRVGAFSNILIAKTPIGALMYAPHGPVFADATAVGPMIDSIRDLARETGAIMFRASAPTVTYPLLMGSGFRGLPDERIAWNTGRVDVILDLAGSLEDLRRHFRQKTRQYLERSLHRGVAYTTSLDPARLYPLLQKNAARVGFSIPPLSHYQALCEAYSRSRSVEIWFATYRGQDVAGLLTIIQGRTIYLLYLGLDLEHYDKMKPSYGIYWHALTRAHERGCTSANWGTCANDRTPREGDGNYSLHWFRAGFGCEMRLARRYCDLVFRPLRYRCIRLAETWSGAALAKLWKFFRDSRNVLNTSRHSETQYGHTVQD